MATPFAPPMPVAAWGLSRCFGARTVFEGLDLEIGRGGRVALRGANGAGKTTLLRCLAGTLGPTHGSVAICGHPAGTRAARGSTGLSLSQERAFQMRLTGRENLEFTGWLRHSDRSAARDEVDQLISELEIGRFADQRAGRCSTGMLQQLAFCRALVGDPPVLLLDEPTRSLDDGAVDRFWRALDRRPDTAVLVATHREDDIGRCDETVALQA